MRSGLAIALASILGAAILYGGLGLRGPRLPGTGPGDKAEPQRPPGRWDATLPHGLTTDRISALVHWLERSPDPRPDAVRDPFRRVASLPPLDEPLDQAPAVSLPVVPEEIDPGQDIECSGLIFRSLEAGGEETIAVMRFERELHFARVGERVGPYLIERIEPDQGVHVLNEATGVRLLLLFD